MKHKFLRLTIIAASSLALGIFTTQISNHLHSITHIPTYAQASNINAYNNYFARRISRYANQRKAYLHPTISYNTRDLGGLKTANGRKQIKPHMLYRSANLHWINQRGAHDLKRLNIKQDIDLRAIRGPNGSITHNPQPGEFHLMADPYHLHLHYHYHPVENSQQEAATWPIRKKLGETSRFGYWYTYNPNALKSYHDSIIDMIRNGRSRRNGAIMYNCTQGRDRTGVLSIVIENLLGVSKYNIYNDFLLTNYYKYQSSYADQISRINRFYATVKRHYGNMHRYVRRGLRLSRYNVQRFRHEYLERIH